MKRRLPVKMIRLVPGLAIPEYMGFLLELCEPVRHTREAIRAGHLLRIDYHPPYLQLRCRDTERAVEEARRRGLKAYRGIVKHAGQDNNTGKGTQAYKLGDRES